jgi:hypothetical protein
MRYHELSPLDAHHEGVRDHVANAAQIFDAMRAVGNFKRLAPYIQADLLNFRRRLHDALTLLDQEISQ